MKSTILNNLILSTFVSRYLCNDRINKTNPNTNKITVAAMSTKLTTQNKQHRQQRLNE